jgi:4-amino-4-deoxy-L-arabinose transferase-like glycosyltransferase
VEKQKRKLYPLLFIVPIGVCASILILWITAYGPGVSPDSSIYVETATSILAGNGFFSEGRPMTHFPPVYPLLLSLVGHFYHHDMLQAARLIGAFLFGVNVVLIGIAVHMCTRRDFLATMCGIFIFLFSAAAISTHSMAWSEPLFITVLLAAFILLSLHIANPSLFLLLAASLAFGLATATRYVGVTTLPPMIFGLVLLGNRPMRHRIKDAAIGIVVAGIPLCAWMIRNVVIAQESTDRSFVFHPIGWGHAKALFFTLYGFVFPVSISTWTKAIHLVVVTVIMFSSIAILHRKNYIRRNVNSFRIVFPSLSIMFALTYISFVLVSISFFDANTPLDARILLPVFIFLTITVVSVAWSLSQALDKRIIWWSFILLVFLSIAINGDRAVLEAVDIHRNGRGYTSRYWRNSKVISQLTFVRETGKIYSNGADVVRFWTKRKTVDIPNKTFASTRKSNQGYEEQLQLMCRECIEGKAIVVYLNGITWRWYLPTFKELESKCNMPVLWRSDDGVIYGRHLKTEDAALEGDSAALHPRQ